MANTPVVVLDDTMADIADAIRGKNGSQDTYKPGEMAAAITAIPSGGGVGIPREVDANGVYRVPTQNFTFSLPADATDISNYTLSWAFYGCTSLTSADFSSLTAVSGSYAFSYAFSGCTSLTSADFSSLTAVSGSYAFDDVFSGCTSLTSVDLSSLTVTSGNASSVFSYAFRDCTSLVSVDLSSLTTVSGGYAFSNAFSGCTSLTSVDLSSLTTVNRYGIFSRAFYGCTSLASLSFPALTASSFGSSTDQFNDMLSGVTGCTVHFPASIQSTIGSWSSVTSGFGGTNTTVLFDL